MGGWGLITNLSPHPVVVDFHTSVDISRRPAGVKPVSGKAVPETDIVAAAPPLPGLLQGAQVIWQRLEKAGGVG